jgi:hypothetical protein
MITTQVTVGSTSCRVLTGLTFCCLQYVLDLMDGDVADQIRLQLPMYIGMRYGTVPSGMADVSTAPPHRISISADVRMQGAVKKITSPTHPTVTTGGSGSMTSCLQNAHYVSQDLLKQDFVLSITAEGLDAARCFAQRAANGATAIQLNIVPKFNLPSISRQEYIFLVDRSGSMGGSRIETAKRTLVMLLRALPSQGTQFNIFSFGSRCSSLWESSVAYTESTLAAAVSVFGSKFIAVSLSYDLPGRRSMLTECRLITAVPR